LKQGTHNRRVAATKLNMDSSRSHSVFTVEVMYTNEESGSGEQHLLGTLWIVDLAGSERGARSGWDDRWVVNNLVK